MLQLRLFVSKPKLWEKEQFQWLLKSVMFLRWLKTRLIPAIHYQEMQLNSCALENQGLGCLVGPQFLSLKNRAIPEWSLAGRLHGHKKQFELHLKLQMKLQIVWEKITNDSWVMKCSTAQGGLSQHQPPIPKARLSSEPSHFFTPNPPNFFTTLRSCVFQHYSKYI